MKTVAKPFIVLFLSCLLPLASCAQGSSETSSSQEQSSISWNDYFEVKRIEVESDRATITLKAKPVEGVASYYVRIAPSDNISAKQEQTVSPSENDVTLSFDRLLADTTYNLIVGINKTDGGYVQLLEREFTTAAEYISTSSAEDSSEESSSEDVRPSQTLSFDSIIETAEGFKVSLVSSAKTEYFYSIFYDDDTSSALKEERREMEEGKNEISFPASRKFECGFLFRYCDLNATEPSDIEIRFDQINFEDPARILAVTPLNIAVDGFDLQIKTYNPGSRSEIQVFVGGALHSSFTESGTKTVSVSGLNENTPYPVSVLAKNSSSLKTETYAEQNVTTLAKDHGKPALSITEKGEDFVRFDLSSTGPTETYSLKLYAHGSEEEAVDPISHRLADGENADITINDLEPGKEYDYRLYRIDDAVSTLVIQGGFTTPKYERGSARLSASANHEDHCYHIEIVGVQNPGDKTYFELFRFSTNECVYQGQPKEGEEVLVRIDDATKTETFYLTAGFEGEEKTEVSRVSVDPIEGEFAVDVLCNVIGGTRLVARAPKGYETLYLTLYLGGTNSVRYEVKAGEENLFVSAFERYVLSLGKGCDIVLSGNIALRPAESVELSEFTLDASYDSVSIHGKFVDADGAIDEVKYRVLKEGNITLDGQIALDEQLAFSCVVDGLSEKTDYQIVIIVTNRFTFVDEEKSARNFTTTSYLDEVPHGVNVTLTAATNSSLTVSATAFGETKMTYNFYWNGNYVGYRELSPGESQSYTVNSLGANTVATFSAELYYGGEWIKVYEGQFKTTVNPVPTLKNFDYSVTGSRVHFEIEVEQGQPNCPIYIDLAGQTKYPEWREGNQWYCDFYINYGVSEDFEFYCLYQKDASSEQERVVLKQGTAVTSAYFDLYEPEASFSDESISPYSYSIAFDVTYGQRYVELVYNGPCDVSLAEYNGNQYGLNFPHDYDGETFTLRFYATYGKEARLLSEKDVKLPDLEINIAEERAADIGKEYIEIRCYAATLYNCDILWKWDDAEIENGYRRFDGLVPGSEHTLSLYRKYHGEFVLAEEKKYQTHDALSDFELVSFNVTSGYGSARVNFRVRSDYAYLENMTFEIWSKGAVFATVYTAGLEKGEGGERHGSWNFDMGRYFCYEDVDFYVYYEGTQQYRKIADVADVCSLHYAPFTDYNLTITHSGIRLHTGVTYSNWPGGPNDLLLEVYDGETLLFSKRSEEGLGGIWEAIGYSVETGGNRTFRVVLSGLFPNGSKEAVAEKEVVVRCYTPFELAEGYSFEIEELENDAPRTHLHTGHYDADVMYEGQVIYVLDGVETIGEQFDNGEEHIYGRIPGLPNSGEHSLKVYLEVSGVRKLVYEGTVEGKPIAPTVSCGIEATAQEITVTLNNPDDAWTYFCRFNTEEADPNYGENHVFSFQNYIPGSYYDIYLYGYHKDNTGCIYLLNKYSVSTPEDKTVITTADISFEYYSAVIDLALTPGALFDEVEIYFDGKYFRFGKSDIVDGHLRQRLVLTSNYLSSSTSGNLLITVVHKTENGTAFYGADQISQGYSIETYYHAEEHDAELTTIQTSYSQSIVKEGLKISNIPALSSLDGDCRIYADGELVYEASMEEVKALEDWIILPDITNENATVTIYIDSPYGNYQIR